MSIQTIGCDVRGFCVPSVGDWNQESGRFLVEERIVKIAKLKTLFLEDCENNLVVEIFSVFGSHLGEPAYCAKCGSKQGEGLYMWLLALVKGDM